MSRELEIRLAKQRITMAIEQSTVLLCDDAAHATRIAKAIADAGATLIDGAGAARSTVASQFGRKVDADRVASTIAALHLPEDVLDWRPRDLSALQRLLADSLIAVEASTELIVFDVTHVAASPFDVAHAFAHIARVRATSGAHVLVLVADPAFISSAGSHLVVVSSDTVAESGAVSELLARPTTDVLLRRLEATPIASPLAMQLRRVQRTATSRVNYSHTQIITLPTQDSIALAGGDE